MYGLSRPAEILIAMFDEPGAPTDGERGEPSGSLHSEIGFGVHLQTIVEAAQEGVWLLDTEGRTTFANARMAEILGVELDELVGRCVFDFLGPLAKRTFAVEASEVRLLGGDGAQLLALVASRPLIDAEGDWIGTVVMVTDITAARTAEAALLYDSCHDGLTGLPDRALFLEHLGHAVERRRPAGGGMAVLIVDIDRFRWVNDSLGPRRGDELLVAMADRLRAAIRPSDTLARSGGDEYAVLCENLKDEAEAMALAKRVAQALTRPFTLADRHFGITVTVGLAFVPPGRADGAEAVLYDADAAMQAAKKRGGGRVELFDDESRRLALGRVETETQLRDAVDLAQFEVHYQPVVELASGRVVGVEALVRWKHPERGLVAPLEFVPVAEDTGLIVAIGAMVLRSACNDVAAWNRSHPNRPPLQVAVNLSARQLVSSGLTELVAGALEESGLDPSLLCLEITESVLMEDGPAGRAALLALKDLGVMLAVDDFGTGYSSLIYLRQFPVDLLKVDRSFVAGLGHSPQDSAIVAGVVGLAQGLELVAVAEGVETSEQAFRLAELGCGLAQGYHWSRALAFEDLGRWLDAFWAENPVPVPRAGGPTRVLIADDQRHVRDVVRLVLEMEGHFEVVAEAGDGWEAVEMTRLHQPDVILLDLLMPGMGGAEALPHLHGAAPGAQVVVLTSLEPENLDRQTVAGVAECLEKGGDLSTIANRLVRLVRHAA